MPRANKLIDASYDEVQVARETAMSLMEGSIVQQKAEDLFFTDDLTVIENGLRSLNEFSNKAWLLSSIILYTLVYNHNLYAQSGLTWEEYQAEARERIGLDKRDISEQLSAARFYIKNHDELERKGFNATGSNRKLARAELATELCGDKHLVIEHIVNDSWTTFKDWYSQFKYKKAIERNVVRNDIDIKGNRVYIQGIEAVKVSDRIPAPDKERIEKYLVQIIEAIRCGYEPAVVECYDEKEARNLVNLRDKYRQGR